jgi:hypothetical protein
MRALGGFSMNLSVALFSLGVVAPLLEFGPAVQKPVSVGITAVMAALGFAFLAIGVYLIGRADSPSEASEE